MYDNFVTPKYKLCVCMPSWNVYRGGNDTVWFDKACSSILKNMNEEICFFIVENGSTDNTKKYIIDNFLNNKNVNIIFLDRQYGSAWATNAGMLASNSEYVTIVDSDDMTADGHFLRAIEFLDNNKDVDIFGGIPVWVDENDNILTNHHPNQRLPKTHLEWVSRLHNGECFNMGPVMRKKSWINVGMYDHINHPIYANDYDLFLRFAENMNSHMCQEPGYITRMASYGRLSNFSSIHSNFAINARQRSLERINRRRNNE